MVLDMRLSFAGRWEGEARGASAKAGGGPGGAARSLREAAHGVNEPVRLRRRSRHTSAMPVLQSGKPAAHRKQGHSATV